MTHPYKQHKEVHAGRARVHKMHGHFKRGGAVEESPAHEAKESAAEERKEHKGDNKAHGHKGKERLDKHARGGKVKHGKGHTKINVIVAPKGGADAGAPPMGGAPGGPPMPPPGAGAPPPMPPKGPMMPPPGGPMAGGMPGIGGKPPMPGGPGGMKRGGKVKPKSGIASKKNLEHWADYAGSNTKYERGGKVSGYPISVHTGGAGSAGARLAKVKAYGAKAKKNGPI